ncbi:MAG: glycoside hydrolase family 127 protein [Chitinophagaceae bacterium]|nr:glycoside hydrolase family 127 protein [Chitinophagaceae bacterium]
MFKKLPLVLTSLIIINTISFGQVRDIYIPLSAGSIKLNDYLENDIQNSIAHWNKGVVPYAALVEKFRTGRSFFAQGEMWGKAVRSGCMFYRYTQDPELKKILDAAVADLLSTQKANGSISCSEIDKQPDGPEGDLWERKYVLLALNQYYTNVNKDPKVLQSMIDQANCIISQIGYPPKTRIIDLGWSPNHIESSTLLEPIMQLYNLTGNQQYLDFAEYIIEEGGSKGYNFIEDAYNNTAPMKIGGVYPKAYEMMSLFEGLVEYYRVSGDEHIKKAVLNLYHNIIGYEITIIGNGGGDQPFHPAVMGEAWDNTALEQTNPDIQRMMETCVGVTWIKLCSQILRLTGDPSTVDMIEKYAYNGLLGAMKPAGDGFSYVNLLNGVKTNREGWGGIVDNVYVTCCNLNGPMGLAYLPYVAIMNSESGPVINLYNQAEAVVPISKKNSVNLTIETDFPKSGSIHVKVAPEVPEDFTLRMRIPGWSIITALNVNGSPIKVVPGTYAEINRKWSKGDRIELSLDMRCKVVVSPLGSNRKGDNFIALIRGPIVLARDENIDENYNQPVTIISKDGFVDVNQEFPTIKSARMQFRVPTKKGFIQMVDYASVDSWDGKKICTWLPGE